MILSSTFINSFKNKYKIIRQKFLIIRKFFIYLLLFLLTLKGSSKVLLEDPSIHSEISQAPDFFSRPADSISAGIVSNYGMLSVKGNKIVNQLGEPIILRGMSLFWSQWMGHFYNYECIKWLRDDWKCTVIRVPLGVEEGGYLENPVFEMGKIKKVIDACIDLGIYVVIDWHDHRAERNRNEAVAFFKKIAVQYGERPNIIYEIYNEPGTRSWYDIVKPYSEVVIKEIRKFDPDNIIVVGTPHWSQYVDIAARNPLEYENLAYAFHFYAASHDELERFRARSALKRNIALFVTEFGICEHTGDGKIDTKEMEIWFNFMEENMISWCNWSIADKIEAAAALKPGVNPQGNWALKDLTKSGRYVRERIKMLNTNL